MKRTISVAPSPTVRSASTVQRASGDDHDARLTRWLKRILLVDAVVDGGLAHVVQNPRPVGDRLRLGPRLERIAEREHVAVGADAGIAKQIPGAADAVAALEDDVALARAFLLQVIARADAGQPGADDEDVEMFWCMVVSDGGFPTAAGLSIGCRTEMQLAHTGGRASLMLYRDVARACPSS